MTARPPTTTLPPTTFADRAGRTWDLTLNITAVKRVKALTGVNLFDALGGKLMAELADDLVRLVDVVYAIVEPQCKALNITDEAFGESLGGESLDCAIQAFLGALSDFFARPDQRKVIRELAAKIDATMAAAERTALDRLDQVNPEEIVRGLVEQADREAAKSSG